MHPARMGGETRSLPSHNPKRPAKITSRLQRDAETHLVACESFRCRIELFAVARVLALRGRGQIDAIEEHAEVPVEVVARTRVELPVRGRVHRLIRLLGLPHPGQELASMGVRHPS